MHLLFLGVALAQGGGNPVGNLVVQPQALECLAELFGKNLFADVFFRAAPAIPGAVIVNIAALPLRRDGAPAMSAGDQPGEGKEVLDGMDIPLAPVLQLELDALPEVPADQTYIDDFYRYSDKDGRRYRLSDITAPGGAKEAKGNPRYEFLGITRFWRFSKDKMEKLYKEGRIVQTNPGTVPAQKRYLDEMPGVPLQSLWFDIKPIQSQSSEAVSYATQKPETLLERILKLSSNPGDLVLDCFVGSGTTAAVAEKLDRRWIACDLGRFAVHTTRKRLLGIPGVRPFVVQNLGKYERQAWQAAEFPAGGQDEVERQAARDAAYRHFILELYHASPISSNAWLHGVKAGRMVHIGAVDAPVTISDVKSIAKEVWKSAGAGAGANAAVDVLG